jgi:hypothetical protein
VFNVFNRQANIQFDERYNLPSDGDACAGIPAAICGSGGGIATHPNTLDPLGTVPNPRATATNPDYLSKGVAFTEPRSIRLGIRWTF